MIIADTHVHFYPCCLISKAFHALLGNLSALDPSATKVAFLTERKECCFFSDLRSGRIPLPHIFSVEETPEEGALRILEDGKPVLYIFAGRQTATAERLEVLSLTSDTIIEDGLPARDIIDKVNDEGAIPVIPWAFGKWTGKRHGIVKELIRTHNSDKLLIGDSSMRPSFLPASPLITSARNKGIPVIAGSDPLPFNGDEYYMGRYATLIDGTIDESTPVTSIRKLLRSGNKTISTTGSRCNIVSVITRQCKL